MDGLSDEGKKRFGAFLQHCIDQAGFTSRASAAKFIHEKSGIVIPESKLTDLVNATWASKFDFNHMFALLDSGILKFNDDRRLDYNDICEALRGKLDPFTGEQLTNGNGQKTV
jgi:hypothetical protein